MKRKNGLIVAGICLVGAVLIGATIHNRPQKEDNIGGDKSGIRVQVEKVKKEDISTKISSSGKLEAVNTETSYLDINNKVTAIYKKVGDEVKKGDIVLALDKEIQVNYEHELTVLEEKLVAANKKLTNLLKDSSEGEVLKAKANILALENQRDELKESELKAGVQAENITQEVDKLQAKLSTYKELFDEGAVAQEEVNEIEDTIKKKNQELETLKRTTDLSKGNLETLEVQIKEAKYALDLLLNNVENSSKEQAVLEQKVEIQDLENQIYNIKSLIAKATTEVVAPISGIITYLPEEKGVSIQAGSPLVTVIDSSKLKVECEISTYYATDLKEGLTTTVKYVGSQNIELEGKLNKIASIATDKADANAETATIPVEILIDNPNPILKPGFFVDVKIIIDTRENACMVPLLSILQEDDDIYYVYVVKEDGSLEKRIITKGLNNGLYIEANGVEEGEIVVSNPIDILQEGKKVSYVRDDIK